MDIRNPKFSKHFPHLTAQYKKGNVWKWDVLGYTRELSDEDKKIIQEVESYGTNKVYAVVESQSNYDDESVRMTSYLFVDKEDDCCIMAYDDSKGVYYAMSRVINHTWDIDEYGSILIMRSPGGGPVRVG